MECSQNDDEHREHNSELDICLDDVDRNEPSILNTLTKTAVSSDWVKTALSAETLYSSRLNADADPPLQTMLSVSSASGMNQEEEREHFLPSSLHQFPAQVWKNKQGHVTAFEMILSGKKVKVLDGLECSARLAAWEPTPFTPRRHLAIPEGEGHVEEEDVVLSSLSSEDVATATLGPSFDEFAQFLENSKKNQ